MQWRKLGIVYKPTGEQNWSFSHAMVPTPVLVSPDIIRVYVTFCDPNGVGRTGFVDLDAQNPLGVINVSSEPILDIGEPGTFDENGVLACSVVRISDDTYYMYYVGFELGTKIRYRLLSGLAISRNGGKTFERIQKTPILERSSAELYFRGGPMVIYQNNRFRMWYVAGSEWTNLNGKAMPVYSMKYLESDDGIHWANEGKLSLEVVNEDEHGFGRPWVVQKSPKEYQLFYSVRKRSVSAYRLGYAESLDGIKWTRKDDQMGLNVSPGSFDENAIMYSAVISVGNKTYCFYNGDGFGKDGFAVAELVRG